MKSIDSMYDNLFNSDKLDKMFENLKYENNPITEPIDQMTQEIFNTNQEQPGPAYIKADANSSKNGDDDFVVGEPLYQNSNQKAPVNSYPYQYPPLNNNNKNPYYGKLEPIKPYANNPTPNNTNPYYQVPQAGQYFGDWNHKK